MQTGLKILSKRPELTKQAISGAAELVERTAGRTPEHSSAPQPERSRSVKQMPGEAADQAHQASGGAAQHAGQSCPGPVSSRGVAGSRLARETSAAEATAIEAAMQAEMGAAEEVVHAPSSSSTAAAPQADAPATEADEIASVPREGVALEQVTRPACQPPPVEAEPAFGHVSSAPSPANKSDNAATAVQQGQLVEPASAEGTTHDASIRQPAQPDEVGLPKADDSAQLKPSPSVSGILGIAGDASRKRERSVGLDTLEEQEKPLRRTPAQHAEADTPEMAVSAVIEQKISSTAGTAGGPAVSVMSRRQRATPDASAAKPAAGSEGPVAARDDGTTTATHMQADAAHEQPAATPEAHSHTDALSQTATGLHHSHIAPCETTLSAGGVSPAEQPGRPALPSADLAEGSNAMRLPIDAADRATSEMASGELLCEEVLSETPPQAPQQGISHSPPSAAAASPALPGAQDHAADPAKAGGASQDSPIIAAALLQAGGSITVRAPKHKRSAVGAPTDVLQAAAEDSCKDTQPDTAVAVTAQAAADLGASAPADALVTAAQFPYSGTGPPATTEEPTGAAEAVRPTAEASPADAPAEAESAEEEPDKHTEPGATAPAAAESAPDEVSLGYGKPPTAAPDVKLAAAAVEAPDLNPVGIMFIHRQA